LSRIRGSLSRLEIRPTEEDYRDAALGGVWYPTCPYCGVPTPVEPDADSTYCDFCDRQFKLRPITAWGEELLK